MWSPAPTRSPSADRPVLVRAANGASIVAHALAFGGIAALALFTAVPTGTLLLATSLLVGGSAVLMAGDAEHEERLERGDEPESSHSTSDHEPSVGRRSGRCEVRS